jgi:hypothetical protein
LWYSKETGELCNCTVYGKELKLRESFDMKNSSFLGSAFSGKYLLFSDVMNQCLRVIDVYNCKEVTLETLVKTWEDKEQSYIDQTESSFWHFDEKGKYTLCYYPTPLDPEKTRVVVRSVENDKEVFSGFFTMVGQASFDSDKSFVIFHWNNDNWELRRVWFLENVYTYDVLLTGTELAEMARGGDPESFPDAALDFYIFPNSDYILMAYKERFHLIDVKAKRVTACSNQVLGDDAIVTGYCFFRYENHVIAGIFSEEPSLNEETDYEQVVSRDITAVRFSYKNVNGRIVIQEDAYADELGLVGDICLLILFLTGSVLFLYIGYKEKERVGNRMQTDLDTRSKRSQTKVL